MAEERIGDDVSRQIRPHQGAHIVRSPFRNSPAHAAVPILTGLLFRLRRHHRCGRLPPGGLRAIARPEAPGWRDFPTYVVWVGVALGLVMAEGIINNPSATRARPVVQPLRTFMVAAIFFGWTMHFLVAGSVPWRLLIRPALVTAVLWLAVGLFASLYFS